MKTIIKGNSEILKEVRYFKCKFCGWAGSAEKGEYKYGDQREPDCWLKCPCCKNTADEVTSSDEIAALVRLEKRSY